MNQRNVDDDLDWEYAEQQFERLREALAQLRRYEAVIEAARALYYAWMRQTKEPGVVGPLNRLFDTLEALDKAEEE